jgi:LysR family transcriptional regulator, regulator for metE and metH
MNLDLRHLRLVAAIADAGSVTRAGDRLHLTQSALSHQLRDVEERLGTPLFTRLGRRMVLTPAGDRVRQAASRVLDEVRRAEEDVGQIARHGAGSIRVCAQCNTAYYWLPPLLARFERQHPAVEVRILPEVTTRPVAALLEGMLDVALLIDEVEDTRLRIEPLFGDEHVALVAAGHRLAGRAWIAAKDLEGEHLVLYSTDPKDNFTLGRVLAPAGIVPARVSNVQLTEAIVEMVRAGLGVGVLPRWSVEPALASGAIRALRITRRGVARQWSAAQLRAREEPPFVRDFLDLLKAQAMPALQKHGPRSRASNPRQTPRRSPPAPR